MAESKLEVELSTSKENVLKCAHYLAIAAIETNSGEMSITLSDFSFRDKQYGDIKITVRRLAIPDEALNDEE